MRHCLDDFLCVLNSPQARTAIADALVATHKELEERTKSGLARAAARAAEAAHALRLTGSVIEF
jgi:hypothetical protein